MKLSIGISVDVHPTKVHRWIGLEGQALLDDIKAAIEEGEEVTIKLNVKKEVHVMQTSIPPMFKMFDRDHERTNGN